MECQHLSTAAYFFTGSNCCLILCLFRIQLTRSIKVRGRCQLDLVKLDSLSALGLSPWTGLSFEFYVFVLISSDHFFPREFVFFFFCVLLTLSVCKEGVCFYKVPVLSDLHHLYGLAFCHCGSCLAAVCYVLTGVCYKAEDRVWLCLSNFLLYGSHKPMLLKCSLWRERNSDNKSLEMKETGQGWGG